MNPRSLLRSAFTLIEMLVVIIIITAILLIAVPNFQAMLSSTESTLAESQLKAGLRAAKDAAIRSTGNQDAAAVFSFSPGGRFTIGIYVQVGSTEDIDGASNRIRRDVFVASGLNEPVQLPKGWMVRGYAPPYSCSDPASTDALADPSMQWYETYPSNRPMVNTIGNWVFPETHFYDTSRADDGANRQTFIVRFQAGTGVMKVAGGDPCLILMPGPNANWRGNGPFDVYRADQTDDPARFVTRILNAPLSGGPTALNANQRIDLLGWESSDTVLAKPVSQLALYQENKLAAAIGARVDRGSDCIYRAIDTGGSPAVSGPYFVARTAPSPSTGTLQGDINAWITGDTNLNGQHRAVSGSGQVEDAPEARIFTIDRYTGSLQPVEVQ